MPWGVLKLPWVLSLFIALPLVPAPHGMMLIQLVLNGSSQLIAFLPACPTAHWHCDVQNITATRLGVPGCFAKCQQCCIMTSGKPLHSPCSLSCALVILCISSQLQLLRLFYRSIEGRSQLPSFIVKLRRYQ